MDLMQIIQQLEDEFSASRGFLWSKKSLIDIDKCEGLLQDLKASIPDTVFDVSALRNEKHRLVTNAEERAANLLKQAEQRAQEIVNEDVLVQRAEQEAKRLHEAAIKEIDAYEHNAMKKLSQMLTDIEGFLGNALSLVKNSREDVDANLLENERNSADRTTDK